MRRGKDLLQASEPFAREDPRRSARAVAVTLGCLVASVTGTALLAPSPLALVGSALSGLLCVRWFILYHDHLHCALLPRSRWARLALEPIGFLLLAAPNVWRRLHNYHHAHNSQIAVSGIGSFPVMTLEDYRAATPMQRFWYRVYRSPWLILGGYLGVFVISLCLRYLGKDWRAHKDSAVALAVHVVLLLGLGAWLGWVPMLQLYFLPLYLAWTLGAYLFYAQHNFPGVRLRPRPEWDYVEAALSSSSCMELPALMHWFTANIGYHHVHHLNHRIPFYRLPEAMAALPELQQPGRTSLRPAAVRDCLRLKLWDGEQGRMVPFPSRASRRARPRRTMASGAAS